MNKTALYPIMISCLAWCGCGGGIAPGVRYLALGDSITGTLQTDTYPRFLIEELGIGADEFAAEGQGGRPAADGLVRLSEIVEFEVYPNAEIFIHFLGGAEVISFISSHDPGLAAAPSEEAYPFTEELDDLLSDIRVIVRESLELASTQGWQVYIATYYALPTGKTPCDAFGGDHLDDLEAARANEYLDLLNDVIVELAEELDVILVDIRLDNETLLQDPDNYSDCIHPSEQGARIIAQRFAETFNK